MRAMFAAAAVAALASAGAAMAQSDSADSQITTTAGTPVLVRRHVDLQPGCSGNPPQIGITQAPAHGTVTVRPDRFRFDASFAALRFKACGGHMVDGSAVGYMPAAGFHGADAVGWSTTYTGARRPWTGRHLARIAVQ